MTGPTTPSVRRRRLLQSLGIAGIAGIAGCVSTSGDDDTEPTGWGWNVAAQSLQDAAEEYNEENGTDISVDELGEDAWEQRFQTAITSGEGAPEFSPVQNYEVASFADLGGLTDLTDRINDAGIRDDIVDGKWDTVNINGNDYALPWDLGPTGIFYNRERYAEAGIDPDDIETWDDFIEAGQSLPDDVAMLDIPTAEIPQLWRMLFRQLGGQAFTEDGEVTIHSDESVRAAELIDELDEADITTRVEMWSGGWFTSFAEGTIASMATAAWMDGTLRAELPDTEGNWGVYKLPAFEEGGTRASNRGGSNLVIPSQIQDEEVVEEVWEYCLWSMTTPDVQNTMLEEYGLFPSLSTAYDSPVFEEEHEFYDGQAVWELFAEVAEEIEPYRYTPDTPEVMNALETELNDMLDDEQSPEEAMEAAAETVADRTDRDLA